MEPSPAGGYNFARIDGPDEGLGIIVGFREESVGDGVESTRERKTPRSERRRVSLAEKSSTALSQDADVGVCIIEHKPWMPPESGSDLRMFMAAVIVEDEVDDLASLDVHPDLVEEANELLASVTLRRMISCRRLPP